jgi:hypothetical protein
MVTKNATLIVTIWIGRGTSTVTISTVTQSLFVSPSYTILRILGLLRLILILIVAKSLNKKRSHRSHSRQRALPEDDSTKIPFLTHRVSSPGFLAASNSSLSPFFRRHSNSRWGRQAASTPASSNHVLSSIVRLPR